MDPKNVTFRYLIASSGWGRTLDMLISELESKLRTAKAGPWKFTPTVNQTPLAPGRKTDFFGKRTGPLVSVPHVGVSLRAQLNPNNPYGIKPDSIGYSILVAITEDGGAIYKRIGSKVQAISLLKLVEDSVKWIRDFEDGEINLIAFKAQVSPPTPKPSAPERNVESEYKKFYNTLENIAQGISKDHPLSGPYTVGKERLFDRHSNSVTFIPFLEMNPDKGRKYKAHYVYHNHPSPFYTLKFDSKGIWEQKQKSFLAWNWEPRTFEELTRGYKQSWTALADKIEAEAVKVEKEESKLRALPDDNSVDIRDAVKGAIAAVYRRLGWDSDPVEIHGKTIVGFYRSKDIPKERDDYDEGVIGAELNKANEIFRNQIGSWMSGIEFVEVNLEDKDWVSITVTLK